MSHTVYILRHDLGQDLLFWLMYVGAQRGGQRVVACADNGRGKGCGGRVVTSADTIHVLSSYIRHAPGRSSASLMSFKRNLHEAGRRQAVYARKWWKLE